MENSVIPKPDFVAVDFEYAMSEKATISSVGIASFKNGEIFEKFYSLVQPPQNEYKWYNSNLSKIDPRLTENAPSFVEIFPEIYKRLNNNTVVAHGAFNTDKVCLEKAIILHNIETSLNIRWVCTQKICNCGLRVACKVCNIELSHHNALSDAIACGILYAKYLKSDLPLLSEFQRVKNEEPDFNNNIHYPRHLTGDVLKPDFENAKNKTNPFYKKKVVLSGFNDNDRERTAKELKELGADVDANIGNNTNILIVGDNIVGPAKWKRMKANIAEGKDAQIINLSQYNELKK
jgi:DNA polymerase III subunit epsilon